MAEKFTNYMAIADVNSSKIVVPYAGVTNNVGSDANVMGSCTRPANSTVVINGLYITCNEKKDCVLEIFLQRKNYNSQTLNVIKYISVPAGTSFFLERAITLNTDQGLRIKFTCSDSATAKMHANASCIEIIQ